MAEQGNINEVRTDSLYLPIALLSLSLSLSLFLSLSLSLSLMSWPRCASKGNEENEEGSDEAWMKEWGKEWWKMVRGWDGEALRRWWEVVSLDGDAVMVKDDDVMIIQINVMIKININFLYNTRQNKKWDIDINDEKWNEI